MLGKNFSRQHFEIVFLLFPENRLWQRDNLHEMSKPIFWDFFQGDNLHEMPKPIFCKYTERKKKRRVNFIPKFHSSLKKFVKYFTMITKRYMYGTKVPNFIGLWSTSLELLKFIGSYPPPPTPQILKSKSNWKSISGVPPSCCRCCPNSPLDRVNQSIDSSHRDVIPFIDQRIP